MDQDGLRTVLVNVLIKFLQEIATFCRIGSAKGDDNMESNILIAKEQWRKELKQEQDNLRLRLLNLENEKEVLEYKYQIAAQVHNRYHKGHYKNKINELFLEPLEQKLDRIEEEIEAAKTDKNVKGRILESLIEQLD
ncbi:hypothetical protein [Mesobacillus subterraneus]|uniref:Uncharacterized protein n=1 Tax=Mesobacillus subterraneus TaxID=285983 RepID=A0A427TDS6_9BACI|nr:hypothetical protein [Mesobacillus subterraneus]RSD21065.1 hypothetical protein EJA10_22460 [Mesobacillus subterraneus]